MNLFLLIIFIALVAMIRYASKLWSLFPPKFRLSASPPKPWHQPLVYHQLQQTILSNNLASFDKFNTNNKLETSIDINNYFSNNVNMLQCLLRLNSCRETIISLSSFDNNSRLDTGNNNTNNQCLLLRLLSSASVSYNHRTANANKQILNDIENTRHRWLRMIKAIDLSDTYNSIASNSTANIDIIDTNSNHNHDRSNSQNVHEHHQSKHRLNQRGILLIRTHSHDIVRHETIDSIYQIYDEIIHRLEPIHRTCHQSNQSNECIIILLLKDPSYFFSAHRMSSNQTDLLLLHWYLIRTYLMNQMGVFVYWESWSNVIDKMISKSIFGVRLYHAKRVVKLITEFNSICSKNNYEDSSKNINLKSLRRVVEKAASNVKDLNHFDKIGLNIRTRGLKESCQRVLHSRLYQPGCIPRPNVLLSLLVTGLGGCGTHIASKLLQERLHVDVPHESLGMNGSVSWLYAVNDIYAGVTYPHHAQLPYRSLFEPRFQRIVHLVRSPMKHISSFTAHTMRTYQFVQLSLARIIDSHPMRSAIISAFDVLSTAKDCERGALCRLEVSAWSWLLWNAHLDSYASIRIPTEDSTKLLQYACDAFSGERISESTNNFHPCSRSTEASDRIYIALSDHNDLSQASSLSKQNQHPEYSLRDLEKVNHGSYLVDSIVHMGLKYGYEVV